jgi:hypothetical protein
LKFIFSLDSQENSISNTTEQSPDVSFTSSSSNIFEETKEKNNKDENFPKPNPKNQTQDSLKTDPYAGRYARLHPKQPEEEDTDRDKDDDLEGDYFEEKDSEETTAKQAKPKPPRREGEFLLIEELEENLKKPLNSREIEKTLNSLFEIDDTLRNSDQQQQTLNSEQQKFVNDIAYLLEIQENDRKQKQEKKQEEEEDDDDEEEEKNQRDDDAQQKHPDKSPSSQKESVLQCFFAPKKYVARLFLKHCLEENVKIIQQMDYYSLFLLKKPTPKPQTSGDTIKPHQTPEKSSTSRESSNSSRNSEKNKSGKPTTTNPKPQTETPFEITPLYDQTLNLENPLVEDDDIILMIWLGYKTPGHRNGLPIKTPSFAMRHFQGSTFGRIYTSK